MKAIDARKLSDQAIKDMESLFQKEYDRIVAVITNTADSGLYEAEYRPESPAFASEMQKRLSDAGYCARLSIGFPRTLTIQWANAQ